MQRQAPPVSPPMHHLSRLNDACHGALDWVSARPARAVAILLLWCLALYIPGQASLPVTDRDEARFAQATKQMLETGDFIDIRFQEAPRYKKPIGIHWLQSLSVAVFGNEQRTNIWAYRLPSLIAMVAAVLLAWWAARPMFGSRVAFVAAAMLASAVTVSMEARIAKSDAVLFAFIVLAQGALARIYLFGHRKRSEMVGIAALFWVALGLGVLVKGPIAPAALGLTVLTLALAGRDRAWMRNLHASWGIPVMLTVTLPWFIAIAVISGGEFFKQSAGDDFLAKLMRGEENHGAPPGFYFLVFWWSFWPAALVATAGAALWIWRNRLTRRGLWLIASILPYWVVIEIIPTKLPHYILPIYPAIAMAAAWTLLDKTRLGEVPLRTYKQGAALFLVVALAQLAAFGFALWAFEADIGVSEVVAGALVAAFACLAAIAAWRALFHAAVAFALAAALVLYAAVFPGVLPKLEPVWPSLRTAEAIAPLKRCADGPVAFAGYNEPSAVFLHGTDTKLVSPEQAAALLADGGVAYAFVSARRSERFEKALAARNLTLPPPIACPKGFDINGGGVVNFVLYSLQPAAMFTSCEVVTKYACGTARPTRWESLFGRGQR